VLAAVVHGFDSLIWSGTRELGGWRYAAAYDRANRGLCSHAACVFVSAKLGFVIAQLDHLQPAGTNDCLAAHHDFIRGTAREPVLEPRRFQAPPGYHSTKCVASGLFLLLGQGRIKDQLGLPQVPTEITAHGIIYQAIRYRVTVFFVREDFARAVAATDLPHDFTLDDLHWPLPGMVVGFPPRFMSEYVGRDVCYVYAANCDAGNYSVDAFPRCPTITVPRSKVSWQFYAWRDGNLGSFASSYLREDRVDETIAKYG